MKENIYKMLGWLSALVLSGRDSLHLKSLYRNSLLLPPENLRDTFTNTVEFSAVCMHAKCVLFTGDRGHSRGSLGQVPKPQSPQEQPLPG